ncbi:PREDICTED: acrosin-like [Sturnus vulgaris]|uniref:acrosin-like n=1 Tax=Sturnus vulgaris TaxID=9172 RepID=UPI00071A0CD4|nr:PREDICTED: acrosin-like [Sturnus vulgaris]
MDGLGLLVLLTVAGLVHGTWDNCGVSCGLRALPPLYSLIPNDYGNMSYDVTRVVGGADALPGSWPWIVSIQHPWVPDLRHLCGGSLIGHQWVLTAAHCFDQITNINMVYVVIGATQLTQPGHEVQVRHVKQVLIHSYYNADNMRYDIALMELDHPVECSPYIQLACVPDATLIVSELQNCWVAGWGYTTARAPKSSDHLQEAKVQLIDLQLCNSSHWYAGKIHTHNLCAGYPEGNIDTCQGDSGGPLMCQEKNSDYWWVIGITSWGKGCARARRPGVYTSTQYFFDWILYLMSLSPDGSSTPTSRACSHYLTTSHPWLFYITTRQPSQKPWPRPTLSLKPMPVPTTLGKVNSCPFPIKILVEFFTQMKKLLEQIFGQSTS